MIAVDCYVNYCNWDENQEALRFIIQSEGVVNALIEIISLDGETVRRKLFKLRKGKNRLTVSGLGGLLPGSYGWRLGWGEAGADSGVVMKR